VEGISVIVEKDPVPGIVIFEKEDSSEIIVQLGDASIVELSLGGSVGPGSGFSEAKIKDYFEGPNSLTNLYVGNQSFSQKVVSSLPIATSRVLGCVRIGSNLTIDINGVLNGLPGSGGAAWGSIGGLITEQTDLIAFFDKKAPLNSPVFTGIVNMPHMATITSTINNYGLLRFFAGSNQRWGIGKDNVSESGGNAGANFSIFRYADDGSYLGLDLEIARNTGKVTINNNFQVNGTGYFNDDVSINDEIGSPAFYSGFAGSGWMLEQVLGNCNLTVDNLVVRKSMNIYELVVNQIRGTNGSLWVSDSAKIDHVIGSTCYIDSDSGNIIQPFSINDIIRCQKFTGRGVKYYSARVTAIDAGGEWFSFLVIDGVDSPAAGDEVVRIGNTTNTSRQGTLYLTSSDTGSPYMDVLDGVTGYSFSGKTKIRLGNLAGISDIDFGGALTGYGLYGQNVFLKGKIIITGGSGIGSLTDAGDLATQDTVNWNSDITNIPGTLQTPSGSGLFISSTYMGYYNSGVWESYIDNAGNCKFVGVIELGTSTGLYGSIASNIAIKGSDLWENAYDGDSSGIMINRIGYNGGTDHFRDFVVYDGKGIKLLQINGASGTVYIGNDTYGVGKLHALNTSEFDGSATFDGFVEFNGTAQFDGTATFNSNIRTGTSGNSIFSHPVGIGGTPASSALLDLQSTSKALIVPRMTTTQRNLMTAVRGMIIYNTTTNRYNGYNGSWKDLAYV